MTCGVEFVKWFWTGPWLVTCRQPQGHDGDHSEVPPTPIRSDESRGN